ncbi:MAG: alpha/beta fold hydrolase [Propionibacteriaceae bacterium]
MKLGLGDVTMHYEQHGDGVRLLVLHGAGADHREAEACFESALDSPGLQRIYPDLPGMGLTPASESVRSSDDVLTTLLGFADRITHGLPYLLVGHSAGGYFALAMATRRPEQVAGLALVCPLIAGVRDVPEHRVLTDSGDLGDDDFCGYFVVQTPGDAAAIRTVRGSCRGTRRPGRDGAHRRELAAQPVLGTAVPRTDAGRRGSAGLDGGLRRCG